MLALAGAGVAAYNKAMDTIDQTLIVAQPDSASPLPAENKVTDVLSHPILLIVLAGVAGYFLYL